MNNVQSIEKSAGTNLKLQARRVIKASRERVFAAWTKPELIQKWFMPGQMVVTGAVADVRPGGAYRIDVEGVMCDGSSNEIRPSHVMGVYREVVPNERLQFTWTGHRWPDEESLVTVELRDVEGGTELVLTHENFRSEESRAAHESGWAKVLDSLVSFCQG